MAAVQIFQLTVVQLAVAPLMSSLQRIVGSMGSMSGKEEGAVVQLAVFSCSVVQLAVAPLMSSLQRIVGGLGSMSGKEEVAVVQLFS